MIDRKKKVALGLVAVAAIVVGATVATSTLGSGSSTYNAHDSYTHPNHSLTPGTYDRSITTTQVCNGQAAARPRRVSASLKTKVLLAYHVDPKTWHGEIDHLVSREFGGLDTFANLWPEPGSIPNPKDALETRLRVLVCNGSVSLSQARKAETSDWVASYHRWVR